MTAGEYDLEEIRQRADIVEIVSGHVSLRKAGRRLKGLCPFHKERTPSFTLDADSGLWHCFGCKAGGDLFRFVEMTEKVDFGEAVELLARRLGIAPRRPVEAAKRRQRDRFLELHGEAAAFFQACLAAKGAAQARRYLTGRELSPDSIRDFGLGYAPPTWDALLKALAKRGYSDQDIVRSGLALSRDDGRTYDRFRDRLMFPIWDSTGRVIAFGGRALGEDQQPKYLNSPDSPTFSKGRTLYALDRARRAMGEKGRAIVVEGYLDVIACHEAGFPETVATMGTALTPEHVEQLRRRVNELVLAFDADSAGLSAAMRTRELFRQAGIQVLVVDLPEGADPDRVVRDGGPEAFSRLVSAATPITEWELRRVLASAPVSKDGAQKPEVLQEAVSVLARLPEGVEREYYTRWLAREAGDHSATGIAALERAIRAELSRSGTRRSGDRRRTVETTAGEREPTPREMEGVESGRLQRGLLAALLHAPEMAARYLPALEPEDFTNDAERGLFTALRARLQDEEEVTVQALLREVEPDGRRLLAELTVAEVMPEHMEEHIEAAIRRLQEARLQRQEAILRGQFEAADLDADRQDLLQRIGECRRQRSALAGKRLWEETDSGG